MTCIVNADDFGYSSNINKAILQSFKEGWVSSATIMVNMPGFEEACQMVAEHNLHEHIGLHFVLTEGVPLTDGIKRQRRFCDKNGQFRMTREHRLFHLTADEKEAVGEEMLAQIERCRKKGLKLTHVNSHHHIHEEIGIISLIIPLMREFNIPSIRIMGNMAPTCSIHRRVYAILYNRYLEFCGLNSTHYFGSIDQFVAFKMRHSASHLKGKRFEIMMHPMSNNDGVIVDALNKKPIKQLFEDAGLHRKAQSFSGAVYDSNI